MAYSQTKQEEKVLDNYQGKSLKVKLPGVVIGRGDGSIIRFNSESLYKITFKSHTGGRVDTLFVELGNYSHKLKRRWVISKSCIRLTYAEIHVLLGGIKMLELYKSKK